VDRPNPIGYCGARGEGSTPVPLPPPPSPQPQVLCAKVLAIEPSVSNDFRYGFRTSKPRSSPVHLRMRFKEDRVKRATASLQSALLRVPLAFEHGPQPLVRSIPTCAIARRRCQPVGNVRDHCLESSWVQWGRRIVVEVDRMLAVHGPILIVCAVRRWVVFSRYDSSQLRFVLVCKRNSAVGWTPGTAKHSIVEFSLTDNKRTDLPHKLTDMDRWAAPRLGWVHEE
jgi:hypothetical protein